MALKKIAALWKSEKGRAVLRGKTEDGKKVFVFKNDRKTEAKQPDYTVHVAEDDELPETPAGGEYEKQPPPDDDNLPF